MGLFSRKSEREKLLDKIYEQNYKKVVRELNENRKNKWVADSVASHKETFANNPQFDGIPWTEKLERDLIKKELLPFWEKEVVPEEAHRQSKNLRELMETNSIEDLRQSVESLKDRF